MKLFRIFGILLSCVKDMAINAAKAIFAKKKDIPALMLALLGIAGVLAWWFSPFVLVSKFDSLRQQSISLFIFCAVDTIFILMLFFIGSSRVQKRLSIEFPKYDKDSAEELLITGAAIVGINFAVCLFLLCLLGVWASLVDAGILELLQR